VRQLVTFMQKNFVGVDAANGKLLWMLPAKSEYDTNSVTAVAYKDLIIFAREGKGLTAIRLVKNSVKSGAKNAGNAANDAAASVDRNTAFRPEEVWNNKDVELYLNTPVVQGNLLVGLSVRQKGQFFAIDADTGKTVWQGAGRMGENAAILNLGGTATVTVSYVGENGATVANNAYTINRNSMIYLQDIVSALPNTDGYLAINSNDPQSKLLVNGLITSADKFGGVLNPVLLP